MSRISQQLDLFAPPISLRTVARITAHSPILNPIELLLNEHGLDAVAQAFLRVLETGDEFEIGRQVWRVTAKNKLSNKLTLVIGKGKPITITERLVTHNISGERDRQINCAPYWVWDSRKVPNSKRKVPIVDDLLRDIEGALLTYTHSTSQFRRLNPFVDILNRVVVLAQLHHNENATDYRH